MFIPTVCGHAVCTATEPCAYVAFHAAAAERAAAEAFVAAVVSTGHTARLVEAPTAPTLTESWGALHAIVA